MQRITPKSVALATVFSLMVAIASWTSTGNVEDGLRYAIWAFTALYLIPILSVTIIKPKSESVEMVVIYVIMAASGFLLSKPFRIPLEDIKPMLYGAVFGALIGILLRSGGFERLEKFIDEKLQPNIKVKD